ncbi:ATP synthase subunit I [Desmospora profundinema]|uniref:Multisubunit Na+/H+ antiporter MnhE subunit n=1 Tax=Desmospora profundinema TaxID=1571184 RepID=A0ABU1IL53_9BACL|nr:ATP synthase subunit I [Desmospora profundinema]MDR6225511.1 multisubunit Na+/H+ antiporter MnhE subunit [Desmospora profundinema]
MDTSHPVHRQMVRLNLTLLSALAILWYLTPLKPLFAGLILGIAASFYFTLTLSRRLRMMRELVEHRSKRRIGSGFAFRLLMTGVLVLVIARFPHHFNILAFLLGLPVGTVILAGLMWRDDSKNKISGGKE